MPPTPSVPRAGNKSTPPVCFVGCTPPRPWALGGCSTRADPTPPFSSRFDGTPCPTAHGRHPRLQLDRHPGGVKGLTRRYGGPGRRRPPITHTPPAVTLRPGAGAPGASMSSRRKRQRRGTEPPYPSVRWLVACARNCWARGPRPASSPWLRLSGSLQTNPRPGQ